MKVPSGSSSLRELSVSFLIDETGRFLHCGNGLSELLGTTDVQLQQLSVFDLTLLAERSGLSARLRDVLNGRVPTFEWMITRGQREVLLCGELLRLAPAAGRYIIGNAVDKTLHQETLAALAQSESKYQEIFNATDEAIVIHRLDGCIIDINDAWCRLNGFLREEAIGLNADQLPMAEPPYSADDALEKVRLAAEKGPQTFEWLSLRNDGHKYWTEVTLRVTEIAGQRRIIAVARDITQRKRRDEERLLLEESLRHAQKMESIGRLAGGVAHDFNNMMTAINGNIQLVLMDGHLSAENVRCLTEAMKTVESATKVTRQLLAFSRKQVIQPKVISLNDVIVRLEDMLQRVLGEDVRLNVSLSPELGLVESDEGQIEQILVNLAVNARDAMQHGGSLRLETANAELESEVSAVGSSSLERGYYVRLSVIDTGTGMTAEVKRHLFEPFFTTKEVGKGTGLGLAMVYGVVQQNRGKVVIDSEPGQGTRVHIYMPRAKATSKSAAQRILLSQHGKETIVVVEDSEPVRTMAVKVLRRQGYCVYDYPNGEEALAALTAREYEVDLLLTDVVMPGMNGLALAERARELLPNLRVLLTSGYSEDMMADRGVRNTGIEFIEKPYTIQNLFIRVRDVLDMAEHE